jgi:hypothetical protein
MASGSDQLPLAAASSSLNKLQGDKLGHRAGPDAMATTASPVATGHPARRQSQFMPNRSSDSDNAAEYADILRFQHNKVQ